MSQKKLEIAIIGLGKSGLRLASKLLEFGHIVIGMNRIDRRVQRATTLIPSVHKANATVLTILRSLYIRIWIGP